MNGYLPILSLLFIFSCSTKQMPDEVVASLADKYYDKTLEKSPEFSYFQNISMSRHDGCTSNTLEDFKKWENFEDSLYAELTKINEDEITKSKLAYWILKEQLESAIEFRVCKRHLWDVNHDYGWQIMWSMIADFQPVGSDAFRKQAITRWSTFSRNIKMEIENLKIGISQGYSMPKEIVQLVIDQMQLILEYKTEESPLFSPAKRDSSKVFKAEWTALLNSKLLPAIKEYHDFLQTEYLPAARENVSILAIPKGDECYRAYIRWLTTTKKTGEEIFELGQLLVSNNRRTVEQIGYAHYKTKNFTEIIQHTKDTSNFFHSSDEIIAYDNIFLKGAKKECTNWFDNLPSTEIILKPYEPFEPGVATLENATADKPAYYRINLQNPTSQEKSDHEIITVHEGYPGHFLQTEFQRGLRYQPSILKLADYSSFYEGWARYSEQLAEEMKLYSSDLPLIKRRAWPARGMVCDAGLHLKGWTKKQTLDYMMESGKSEIFAVTMYHRMIVWPGKLMSYDVGGEEIKSLRKMAEEKLGNDFNIKEFHTKILEHGSIPLSALRSNIVDWLQIKSSGKTK